MRLRRTGKGNQDFIVAGELTDVLDLITSVEVQLDSLRISFLSGRLSNFRTAAILRSSMLPECFDTAAQADQLHLAVGVAVLAKGGAEQCGIHHHRGRRSLGRMGALFRSKKLNIIYI